ncbi:DNA-ligase [Adoxophyes orana granulovirus]|uniref:DNA ligase n=1 Tax=Adoxophyes orana granulovirus TaxID=170617 RepID=Q7T9R2_GVAO|nr:DNA-ligase [Adoxophyes orana granulovirus]AAP85740.1 DNA-ligase [Adoxophyes orana granulovirus]AJA91743.1 DNA ligase [Adoxophyes orana granulovirus]
MLLSTFANLHSDLINLNNINEISAYINDKCSKRDKRKQLYLWLYLMSTFDKKFFINDKHLLTVFCKINEPHIDRKNLQEAFKRNGVAKTCSIVINSRKQHSDISMEEVYKFMSELKNIPTRSCYLLKQFRKIVSRCTQIDMFCIINLIRNTHRNRKILNRKKNLFFYKQIVGKRKDLNILKTLSKTIYNEDIILETKSNRAIECMLAQPCKSFKIIPFKFLCIEEKHDGERVQIQKFNNKIICYKRNLSVHHKCNQLTQTIERVLRDVVNVVLDCEMVNQTIIVFDIMYHNGTSLIDEPLSKRKLILENVMKNAEFQMYPIQYAITDDNQVAKQYTFDLLHNADKQIEGVVVKDWYGLYESKRKKWFKIKLNYFNNVCSADLVVVGGWKKSTNKIITIYLVATPFYDYTHERWSFLPVSKVKYSKNNYENRFEPYDPNKCRWLVNDDILKRQNKIPNMVARDPFSMPIWEMEGDFIKINKTWTWGTISHSYMSIRLPRFIKVRQDKCYKDANTILDLHLLSTITNKTHIYPELYNFYLKSHNIKNFN